MINLAENQNCDEQIIQELREAGIDLVHHERRLRAEVPASVTGELGGLFTFKRAWYYWVVTGDVPLALAHKMYADETRRDVRVAGHCGSPPPDEWAEPSEEEIRFLCESKGYGESTFQLVKDNRSVKTYHIDTQEGLNFFVKHTREWFGLSIP